MPAGVEEMQFMFMMFACLLACLFVMYFPIRYNNYETSFHCGEHSGMCFLVLTTANL
jgi:hypothetical protein